MALAPLSDVTDAPFRRIIAKYGKPDVMYTEFVSCGGLQSSGKEKLMHNLLYTEGERPIVAQIFGARPENFEKTAKLVAGLGFDGIDINMGCPDKSILKQGAGAALINTPELAVQVIEATKRGAPNLPISVKTRIGFNKNELERWIPELLKTGLAAITVHARTKKQMSKVSAQWANIARAVELRNESGKETLIIGNGDVKDVEDGRHKCAQTGADGAMLGRAIFGNPWLFNKCMNKEDIPVEEVLGVMVEHAKLFEELLGGVKSFSVMKKHFKAYIPPVPEARKLRIKLMDTENVEEVKEHVKEFITSLPKRESH